jgi:hypothetical protein
MSRSRPRSGIAVSWRTAQLGLSCPAGRLIDLTEQPPRSGGLAWLTYSARRVPLPGGSALAAEVGERGRCRGAAAPCGEVRSW